MSTVMREYQMHRSVPFMVVDLAGIEFRCVALSMKIASSATAPPCANMLSGIEQSFAKSNVRGDLMLAAKG